MYDAGLQLFWYRPLFMIELLVSVLLFTLNLRKKEHFALRAGLCIAVLTRGQAGSEPSLLVKNISPTAATRIVLCWKKDRRLSPAARAFIDYVNKA